VLIFILRKTCVLTCRDSIQLCSQYDDDMHFVVNWATFRQFWNISLDVCQSVRDLLISWPVIGQFSQITASHWSKLTHSPMSVTWLRSKYWNSDDAQSQECTIHKIFYSVFQVLYPGIWKWNSSCIESMSGYWWLHVHKIILGTQTLNVLNF